MPSHFATLSCSGAGLLEQLVLRPHQADGRLWLEDAQGHAVGFVSVDARSWWRGRVLTVHEAFEEPVVFRVRRCWGLWARWRVADADGELVGTVAGARLLDHWGRVLFRRLGRTYVTADGALAAEWQTGRLVYHPAVQHEPFSKMLLLAVVLVAG